MARKPPKPLFPTPRTVQPARPAKEEYKPAPAPRKARASRSRAPGLFPGGRRERPYTYREDVTENPGSTRVEKYHDMPDGQAHYGSGFTGTREETDLGGVRFRTYEEALAVAQEEVTATRWMIRAWDSYEIWQDNQGYWHIFIEYNRPEDDEYEALGK